MSQVQNALNPKEIFSITKWHQNKGLFASSPLKFEGKVYSNPGDKAIALRKALLQRWSLAEDISQDTELGRYQIKVYINEIIGMTEIKHYQFNTANCHGGYPTEYCNITRPNKCNIQ